MAFNGLVHLDFESVQNWTEEKQIELRMAYKKYSDRANEQAPTDPPTGVDFG